jgi:hypothetical protein
MEKTKAKVEGGSCWECVFNDLRGSAFLGICTWFEKNNRGRNKEIPSEVVDIGCKHFSPMIKKNMGNMK